MDNMYFDSSCTCLQYLSGDGIVYKMMSLFHISDITGQRNNFYERFLRCAQKLKGRNCGTTSHENPANQRNKIWLTRLHSSDLCWSFVDLSLSRWRSQIGPCFLWPKWFQISFDCKWFFKWTKAYRFEHWISGVMDRAKGRLIQLCIKE